MRRLSLVAALPLLACLPAHAAEPAVTPAQVRETVRKAVGYLDEEGVYWMKQRKCASCHHIPMMVWALNEAKDQGYAVPDKTLAEVINWTLAPNDPAKIFPKPPIKDGKPIPIPAGTLSQQLVQIALGFEAVHKPDPATRTSIRRFLEVIPSQQAADGTWGLSMGGRPPMADSREVMTIWTLLALTPPRADEANPAWKANRDKASKWLAATKPGDTHQALVTRIFIADRLGRPAAASRPAVAELRRRQNADGGWAQTKDRPSDAYATGQTLYAFNLVGIPSADPAVRRAQAFLVKTQRPDGGWEVACRLNKPGEKPSKNAGPISYVSSAWATMGLARTCPPADRTARSK